MLCTGVRVSSTTWYVTIDGAGDAPTVQAAIDSAASGDTIVVGPGHYTWSNQGSGDEKGFIRFMYRKHHILLQSEMGAEHTALDAEYQCRTIYIQDHNHVTIDGFTITGGQAPYFGEYVGGGFFNHISADTIRNCVFLNNRAVYGAGISSCGNDYITLVEHCTFIGNRAERSGGGVHFCCSTVSSVIRDCLFTGNFSGQKGGAIAHSECPLTVKNCGIVENTAGEMGGGFIGRSNAQSNISYCTVARNAAPEGAGICVGYDAALQLYWTIIAFSSGPGLTATPGMTTHVGCCDIYGNSGGDELPDGVIEVWENISLDPLFCGIAGSGNYYLRSDSPCLPLNYPGKFFCGVIGAYPGGCGTTAIEKRSWGELKSVFMK